MSEQNVIECMLLRWGESPAGRTVTLLLPEDPGPHPFKGLRTGPANGQRLAIAVALIADDETTADLPSQPSEKPVSGGNGNGVDKHRLSRQAALCCEDARFKAFLIEQEDLSVTPDGPITPEAVAEAVRILCRVGSRSEFDADPDAADRWRDLHSRYVAWREAA